MNKSLTCIFLIFILIPECREKDNTGASTTGPLNFNESRIITAQIKWEYKKFSGKVKLFEGRLQGESGLWDTGSVKTIKEAPVSTEIANSEINLKPGSNKKFVLVIENSEDKEKNFFATPHSFLPEEHSIGFKFKCLCINHMFTIPPKSIWYRVVELAVQKQYPGENFSISHTIVGVSEAEIAEYRKMMGKEKHHHD